MTRKVVKRKHSENTDIVAPAALPAIRYSDEPLEKKSKWRNKQRVLVFASRGINYRHRHLMEDLKKLMPHHKPESKMERSKTLNVINEMCEMKNCNNAMMFEGRKKKDLYLWLSSVPNGPSVKFLVENVSTMAELKLTGNCLRSSRPLLSFDPIFDKEPQYILLKELFTHIFGVPKHHPKSQPFIDHVYTFSVLDNRIWFRNFQILSEDGAVAEIGPRFVLNPVKIFSRSFGGVPLWENPKYMSPSKYRRQVRLEAKNKYIHRVQQKAAAEATRPAGDSYKMTPLDDIFKGDPLKKVYDLKETIETGDDARGTKVNIFKPRNKLNRKNKIKNKGGKVISTKVKKVKKMKSKH